MVERMGCLRGSSGPLPAKGPSVTYAERRSECLVIRGERERDTSLRNRQRGTAQKRERKNHSSARFVRTISIVFLRVLYPLSQSL